MEEVTNEPDGLPEEIKPTLPKKLPGVGRIQLWFYMIMALTLGAVLGFFVFWYTMGSAVQSQREESPSTSVSPETSPSPTTVPQTTVDPASSENIVVITPLRGDQVTSPIRVTGKARIFESALSLRLKNTTGQMIAEQNVTASSGEVGQFSNFAASLTYPKQLGNTQGTLEVFTRSAQTGTEEDLIQIPVTFQ